MISNPKHSSVKVVPGKRGILVLRWYQDGKLKERSTKLSSDDSANRARAEVQAARLQRELFGLPDQCSSWQSFCDRYDEEHLSGLSRNTKVVWLAIRNHVDEIICPEKAEDVTSSEMSRLSSVLRGRKCSENTIATYMRHLLAALNWAKDLGLIEESPKFRISNRAKGRLKTMRGRPITDQEFQKLLDSVPKARKGHIETWKTYLKGLWWSGLRISEALQLSWDWSSPVSVDLAHSIPRYVFLAEGQKSHRDEILPIAPEFVNLLKEIPDARRTGRVFKLPCSDSQVPRIIAKIGKESGIQVSPNGKMVTAHDLRRSFGSRWATRLAPAELRVLMRHTSIDTTMKYYVRLQTDVLGKKLWDSDRA